MRAGMSAACGARFPVLHTRPAWCRFLGLARCGHVIRLFAGGGGVHSRRSHLTSDMHLLQGMAVLGDIRRAEPSVTSSSINCAAASPATATARPCGIKSRWVAPTAYRAFETAVDVHPKEQKTETAGSCVLLTWSRVAAGGGCAAQFYLCKTT